MTDTLQSRLSTVSQTQSVCDLIDKLGLSSLDTSAHFFLDKIIYNNLIHDTLFLCLSPLDLLRLGRTCKFIRSIIQSYIKRTFNINRFLERFFGDPVAFRCLQAQTGTLISGSCALQFMDRSFYPGSDLDLYIPPYHDREVLTWLTHHDYRFVPSETQPKDLDRAIPLAKRVGVTAGIVDDPDREYADRSIEAVYNFSRSSPRDPGVKLKVQCIVSRRAPLRVVLSFHSTCVMNIITYEKAYCLYPRATVHEHRALVCGDESVPSRPDALRKYVCRGFVLVRAGPDVSPDDIDKSFPIGPRYIGDPQCWTLPLEMEGVTAGCTIPGTDITLSGDPVSISSWRLVIYPDIYPNAEMVCGVIHTMSLHFGYVFSSVGPIIGLVHRLGVQKSFRRNSALRLDEELLSLLARHRRVSIEL